MLRVKFLLSFCLCSFIAVASDLNKGASDALNASKETELTKENKARLQNEIQPSKKDTVTQKALEKAKNEEFERKFSERGSLFDAMECSLRNNKEILSAQSELRAYHEQHVSASAAFRPKVSLNTKYRNSSMKTLRRYENAEDNVRATDEGYKDKIRSYGIGVNQNLFHGFSDVAALKEVEQGIRAQWSKFEAKKQEVLRNVAIVYFSLLAKRDEISHLRALMEAGLNSQSVAEWMYKTGAVKYLDVSQAIARVAETEAKLAKAASEYIAYCAQFEELTGYKVPQELTMPKKIFDESITEKQALEIAKKHNPEIIAARYAYESAKIAIKKPNRELVPSLDLSVEYDHTYNGSKRTRNHQSDKLREKGATVSLQMTVPIYDGGVARSEKRKYIDAATKAAVDLQKTIENVKTQITAVFASMAAAKQSLISAQKAVEARQVALNDAEEEYKSGVKIMKDVLDAQEQLFDAKAILTKAENDYFSSQCRARALIGRMNETHLKLKGNGFSYQQHYAKTRKRF